MRDGLGREIRVPAHPRRIVSLAPSVTDSLLALGSQDRLVGVSDFCELPPGAGAIVRIGGMLNPSLETIRGLRPDLLVATTSGNDPSLARQADSLGLPKPGAVEMPARSRLGAWPSARTCSSSWSNTT